MDKLQEVVNSLGQNFQKKLDLFDYVDFNKPSLWIAAVAIAFNPLFWNIVARTEYRTKFITKAFKGNAYYGCYALAVTIFTIGIIRDSLFERALRDQNTHPALLESKYVKPYAAALFAAGNVFVLSSMWALGVTGTYLGDYFGILMDDMVSGFPFNISSCPMYLGSTLSFLATTLWYGTPAGLLLTAEVWVAYVIALRFEDPFTSEIYAKRDREREESKKEK